MFNNENQNETFIIIIKLEKVKFENILTIIV